MTGWYILGGIVLLFVLIALTPTAAEVFWDADGFRLLLRIWFIRLRLGSKDTKEKKPRKTDKETKDKEKPAKKLPPLPVLKLLAKHGFHLLGRIVSRFRVRILKLHILVALDDPAATAMTYGALGTAMEGVLAAGGRRLREPDLKVFADLEGAESAVDLHMLVGIRIGQLLGAALRFGMGFLKDYLPLRRELNTKG